MINVNILESSTTQRHSRESVYLILLSPCTHTIYVLLSILCWLRDFSLFEHTSRHVAIFAIWFHAFSILDYILLLDLTHHTKEM